MKKVTYIICASLMVFSTFVFTGCREEKKSAGDKIEDAIDDTGDAIEDAADEVEDAVEDAVDDN